MTAGPIRGPLATVVIVASVVLGGCAPSGDPRWDRGDPQRVVELALQTDDEVGSDVASDARIELVDRGAVRERVTADGVVALADAQVIVAPVDGRVQRRVVAVGSRVEEGDDLLVLGPPPRPSVDDADAATQNEATAEDAGPDRADSDSDDGADDSAEVVVRSSVDGTVGRYPVRTSEVVAQGDPLVEIGDPARRIVLVELDASIGVRIDVGTGAVVTDPASATPEPTAATVSAVRSAVDGVVRVDVAIDGPGVSADALGALEAGDRLIVSIAVRELSDVLRVPTSALRSDDRGEFLVVDRGDRWERVDVVTGPRDGDVVSLLSPGDARVGDRVVVP
ncbi:MAG: HlyD family efflux transporter periplasmic adaptor subunit [Actinomycetota bacterium]